MKKTITIAIVSLMIFIVSATCLAVFMPHLQRDVRMSGGVLQLEFEDGRKQYAARGEVIRVELNTRCNISVVTSVATNKHVIKVKDGNGNLIDCNSSITFDERRVYIFDLYEESGNFTSFFCVEVV